VISAVVDQQDPSDQDSQDELAGSGELVVVELVGRRDSMFVYQKVHGSLEGGVAVYGSEVDVAQGIWAYPDLGCSRSWC